jgi:hypothetical protein
MHPMLRAVCLLALLSVSITITASSLFNFLISLSDSWAKLWSVLILFRFNPGLVSDFLDFFFLKQKVVCGLFCSKGWHTPENTIHKKKTSGTVTNNNQKHNCSTLHEGQLTC